EIARRRAEGVAGRADILSMLVAARDEDGQPMSDQELRDEMVTLLLAGHETTATSLAWAFHRLLGPPDVRGKLPARPPPPGGGGGAGAGGRMRDQGVRDEMAPRRLAGQERRAPSLAWAVHRRLGGPDVRGTRRAELRAAVEGGCMEPGDVARLEYLDAVVK